MKEQILKIKENSLKEIKKSTNLNELSQLKVKYLGKKGELTTVLRTMGGLSNEERPIIGALVNTLRDELDLEFSNKEKELKLLELNKKLETENIDVTEPSKKLELRKSSSNFSNYF